MTGDEPSDVPCLDSNDLIRVLAVCVYILSEALQFRRFLQERFFQSIATGEEDSWMISKVIEPVDSVVNLRSYGS